MKKVFTCVCRALSRFPKKRIRLVARLRRGLALTAAFAFAIALAFHSRPTGSAARGL